MTYPWFALAGLLVLCAGFLTGSRRPSRHHRMHVSH